MYNSRLDQMTGAIQFMQVAKVFKTVTGPPRKDVAIQVTVRLLGACEKLDGPVDESFKLRVFVVLEISARGLEPFADIRVPEDATSPVPCAGFLPAAVHALVEPQGIQLALMPHFIVDVGECDFSDLLLQPAPEAAGESNARLIERLPGGKHV